MGSFQSVLTGGVSLKSAILGLKRLLRFSYPELRQQNRSCVDRCEEITVKNVS